MPKVNKIRVTNIKLGRSDEKVIGEKTWELFGNNTIFLLENGGGKTSIIQLIHQVVLPNHIIQKRNMIDGVKKDSTRHIAVEWVSDNEQHSNFVTGFCFHNFGVKRSKTDDRTYEYFNYIFEYDKEEWLCLEDLPFTQNGKVTNLEQLKQYLKEVPGVHFFSSNKEYQEALSQYGLLDSEWRNSAKINGEEGGVTKFFDNTNRMVTLIDRLLIPSLTESLYDTPEEQRAIVESFRKYQEGLLELPELEKNLQDFDIIINHSEPIIDSFKQYEQAVSDLETAKENLTRLYVTLSKNAEQNEDSLTGIEDDIKKIADEQIDLEWKIDSYPVHLLEQTKMNIQRNVDETERELDHAGNEEQLIQRRIKEQLAAKAFNRYTQYSRTANEIESIIRVAEIKVKDRNNEFLKVKKEVSQKHRYLMDLQLTRQTNAKNELKTTEQKQEEITQNLETKQEEQTQYKEQISRLKTMVEQHQRDHQSIQEKMGDFWEKDAAHTADRLAEAQTVKKEEVEDTERKLTALSSELEQLHEVDIRLENEIPNTEKKLSAAEEQFNVFVKDENLLKEVLSSTANVSVIEDLFRDKDTILFQIDRRKWELDKEYTNLSVSLEHLVQIKNGIEQRGYHVHPEIERITSHLEKKGVDVVSGVEWMTKLTASSKEKKKLLRKNPMFLFSILMEASQLNEIKSALKLYKEELTVPIVFLDRLQMDNQEEKGPFHSLEDHLYVFNQINARLTADEWERYVIDLEGLVEEKVRDVSELRDKLDRLCQTQFTLQDFLKTYNENSRDMFVRQANQLKETILRQKKEKQQIEDKIEQRKTEKENQETVFKQLTKEMEEIQTNRMFLQEFLQKYAAIQETFEALFAVRGVLQSVIAEINALKRQRDFIKSEIDNHRQTVAGINDKINHLDRDFTDYKFEQTETKMETNEESYRETISFYNELRSQSSDELVQLENYQTSLANYKKLMEETEVEITKNGYTLESIGRLQIVYDEGLHEQLEGDWKEMDEYVRELDKKLAVLQQKLVTNKEQCEEELQKIDDNYKEDPFEYGPAAESELTLYRSEHVTLKVKETKLVSKREMLKNTAQMLATAIREAERREEYFVPLQKVSLFKESEWDNQKPMDDLHRYQAAIEKKQRTINERNHEIQTRIWDLKSEAQDTGNTHLVHSMSQFVKIFEGSSYEETFDSFYKMIDGIDGFRQSLESRRKHSDHSRNELIQQMYQRSEMLHKNIVDIAKSSQIEVNGNIIHLIKINWPKNEYNHSIHQLRTFVNGVLEELVILKNNGGTEREIEEKFERLASLYNIVNCYSEVSKCNIQVLKPKNDLLSANVEYVTWDQIDSEWSGGERQVARISMYISFLNHLRKTRFAKELSWKFVVFDNPFDKMQSDHVVKPMIELAKRTKTQLFCLTGIDDRKIQKDFDTVISNEYIFQQGTLLLESEVKHSTTETALEALFYAR